MREVTASAPGKVNLTLHVGAPTDDGYHPLVTVFEAVNIRETVTVRTKRQPGISVETTAYLPDGTCDQRTTAALATLPPNEHLAVRAAKILQRLAMATPWAQTAAGLTITVDKRVPMAGGMAGGSADAAAALLACNELWDLGLDGEELQVIGRTLGADVPACLVGGIALGTGRGDHLQVLTQAHETTDPCHHWVFAMAHQGLSTPEVFRALDAAGGPGGAWSRLEKPSEQVIGALTGSAEALAPHLHNDLQTTAIAMRPELAATVEAARNAGAIGVVLSGSGPTVAALCTTSDDARAVAMRLTQAPQVSAVALTSGPAVGARIESAQY
ncbi:4-(cytidine 5'-diphospho)-2-C-methyl-D-erythritol kinase [Schaalia suimastitidis]|uniref:4-(cytidine 5'-diphospho)-2-C-methyl-D-erythritol kinase n=1 Tax=Schaalia suimastitidis TaxID=121163 RepID=UPI00047C60E4|nr:4-(cytidine 5'-diphospho)-2-C-methyl-D-erythritol kinase [Schaalia suimastitidis]